MGMCNSSESTSVATAKLIRQDGQLEEFSYPVSVSQLLQRNPMCFICNADDMGFDDYVFAINGDEHLQTGELYFALPVIWLNNPLTAQQMADLAVKASLALNKLRAEQGKCSMCGARKLDVVECSTSKLAEARPTVAVGGVGGSSAELIIKRIGRVGHRERKFTKLSAISEE